MHDCLSAKKHENHENQNKNLSCLGYYIEGSSHNKSY